MSMGKHCGNYLQFVPPQNSFTDFPARGRPLCLFHGDAAAAALARKLGAHYRIKLDRNPEAKKAYSFFLGPASKAPAFLRQRIQASRHPLPTGPFVYLLPDARAPAIWIGGATTAAYRQSVRFLNRFAQLLLQGRLIAGDFHIHSDCSDGLCPPERICYYAVHNGLDTIAVTDHNTIAGAVRARAQAPKQFPVLLGEELTDDAKNHLVVLGLRQDLPAGQPVQRLIAKWKQDKLFFVQAHPTGPQYFITAKNKGIGVEAFNYASSAPELGRRYYRENAGRKVMPVLGNSDAHLPENIGKARTYMNPAGLTARQILAEIKSGRTVAFFRGNFCGEPTLAATLAEIYASSNLLSGKLRPLSPMARCGYHLYPGEEEAETVKSGNECWFKFELPAAAGVIHIRSGGHLEGYVEGELRVLEKGPTVVTFGAAATAGRRTFCGNVKCARVPQISVASAGPWKTLKPATRHPAKRVFCSAEGCACSQEWYRLDQGKKETLLQINHGQEAILGLNSCEQRIRFHAGMEMDLMPFLKKGNNLIEVPGVELRRRYPLRVCSGTELQRWEIKMEERPWQKIMPATNLQCLGLAPKNYRGVIIYRTRIPKRLLQADLPALFFEGLDGEAEVFVNGKRCTKRGMAHWWDSFELRLPRLAQARRAAELVVRIKNEVGLCGITNWVFAGKIDYLKKRRNRIKIMADDLLLLRCGQGKMRAFLCDSKGMPLKSYLRDDRLEPLLVTDKRAKWLQLNYFAGEKGKPLIRLAPLGNMVTSRRQRRPQPSSRLTSASTRKG